ncbi:hypothetical protein BKA69DRAFT_1072052 [Paraphysoderma sedebokerense]|nr:hypothetical protein BKA69DRAFT_1072052 [Paraphysoderma sedebokerense]
MSRKIELLEKNYTTENKNLRGKLHTMDYENRLVKDKLDKLEEEMRVCIYATYDLKELFLRYLAASTD